MREESEYIWNKFDKQGMERDREKCERKHAD